MKMVQPIDVTAGEADAADFNGSPLRPVGFEQCQDSITGSCAKSAAAFARISSGNDVPSRLRYPTPTRSLERGTSKATTAAQERVVKRRH